jgi:hypothetical protein
MEITHILHTAPKDGAFTLRLRVRGQSDPLELALPVVQMRLLLAELLTQSPRLPPPPDRDPVDLGGFDLEVTTAWPQLAIVIRRGAIHLGLRFDEHELRDLQTQIGALLARFSSAH